MIVCDVFFKEFYAHGSDDYLCHWAAEVDWMAAEGWRESSNAAVNQNILEFGPSFSGGRDETLP